MKNSILFCSLILLISLPLTSCSKDESDVAPTEQKVLTNNIVGTWEHIEYPYEDIIFMVRLQFKDDGSYLGDGWELRYGVQGYENALLNKAQVTALVRNKPWSIHVEAGTWAVKDGKILFVGGFFNDHIYDYTIVNNVLVIAWDDEETMFAKI